jgi:hypothetical protein
LTSENAQGVESISEDFENDLQFDVKLFTILYADDTVLLAVCWRIALRVEFTHTDKLCTLPLFKMSYIALDAFSARLIFFFLKDPILWNIVPNVNIYILFCSHYI